MMDSPENDPPSLSGPAPAAALPNGADAGLAADGTAALGRRARRWTAVLLSLDAPGLGHLAIGYPGRMVAWYSCIVAILAVTVVGTLRGAPATILLALVVALVLRLAAAVHTLLLDRPPTLPRPRHVVIMVVGFSLFWHILAFNLRSHVMEAFQIPTSSTYPTLLVGDHVYVSKLDRGYGRGDLVVFRFPMDPKTKYVKRIVGVAGDEIQIRDGVLIVNGTPTPRTRTSYPCALADGGSCVIWEEELAGHHYQVAHDFSVADFGPVIVEPGQVFVMGDNRENSSDSRVWGGVKLELMVGKVIGIWWSKVPHGDVRWERLNLRVE
jgi:signal peptidase I